jgi:hypothetical protein
MKDIARRLLQLAKERQHNDYGYDHGLNGLQNAYVHMMIGEARCRTWADIVVYLQDWFHDNTKFDRSCSESYKAVFLLKKHIREYSPIVMITE